MNTEQERADFEAWYADYHNNACDNYGGIDCSNPKGIAYDAWQAGRAALQAQDREDAKQVLDALDNGEWKLTRNLPLDYLTDTANAQQAWMVERQVAPFCDSEGMRVWVGPTAIKALRRGQKAIDHARRVEGEQK